MGERTFASLTVLLQVEVQPVSIDVGILWKISLSLGLDFSESLALVEKSPLAFVEAVRPQNHIVLTELNFEPTPLDRQ